ncbi:MAG: T9SS type A sorting domain-containing protein [Flavobacterium sp.]|uniref:T9SS type A sorting domain-containing protein n=1 Tax=Flavobacterium sp. TaxID=239 RepID=UPI003BE8A3FD
MKNIVMILLMTTISYSQSISRQVIGTAGKTQSNSNLKVSWTTGEPVVGLMTAGGNQLGNGYYPALDLQALSVEDNVLDVQLRVYPNPTSQSLYVTHPDMNSFGITIMDLNGKQLYLGTINKEEPLDVSKYTQGMYLVTVENKETQKKNTYKIIKK